MIHHICIQTNNYDLSLQFYTKILNFELIKETKPFKTRSYNSWLKLDDFYIELQTLKKDDIEIEYNPRSLGIAHFCLYNDNLEDLIESYRNKGFVDFKYKNKEIIYQVEGGKLFKIVAPEGTIIEFRDSILL